METVRRFFLDPPVSDADFDRRIDPDVEAARTYVVEEWGVDADEVARGFERIRESQVQTGLDRWS